MYLKRLELAGFKTFADRTVVEFSPGITAIVGPNGSGKSNLQDAVRWALGEPNVRALRGARTEDIIFAGSEGRRAHGLAEVTLTLDNADRALPLDFSEISVTRRATRGGESEFLLNRVPCRLRDIQMLFLGTGLGGRSYAMVGQGEVDAVLNASPQERRLWLEEAAGLARYKRRRAESLRRLEHAAQHLQRLGDLLGELRAQHAHLAEQAAAARQYRDYTAEIAALEQGLLADEGRRLQQAQRRLAAQVASARTRLDEVTARAAQALKAAEALAARREVLARQWEALQQERLTLTEHRAAADAGVERARRRLEEQQREESRLRAEAAQAAEELAQVEEALAALEHARGEAERAAEALRAQLSSRPGTPEMGGTPGGGMTGDPIGAQLSVLAPGEPGAPDLRPALRRAVEEAQARREAAVQRQRQAAERLAAADAALEALARQAEAALERLRRAEARAAQAADAEGAAAERLHHAEEYLAAARTARAAREAARAEAEAALRAAEARSRAAEVAVERLESRLQALQEAGPTGAEGEARALLQAMDEVTRAGLLGLLAEQVTVDARARAAVEAVLGPRLFALMTADFAAAAPAVAAARRVGVNATFLPLADLRPRSADVHPQTTTSELPQVSGLLGPAVAFVSAPPPADRAVAALLGDALIAETLDAARIVRRQWPGPVATVAGEVLWPDGAVTVSGGAAVDASPPGRQDLPGRQGVPGRRDLLGRQDLLAEAERELAQARAAYADAEAARGAAVRALEDAAAALSAADQEVAALEREVAEAAAHLEAVRRERAHLPSAAAEARSDAQGLQAQVEEVRRSRAALADEVAAAGEEAAAAAEALAVAERALDAAERAVEQDRAHVERLRLRLAELEARLEGLRQRREDFTRARETLARRHARLLEGAGLLAESSRDLAAELAEVERGRDELVAGAEALRMRLEALEAERAEAASAQAAAQETVKGLEAEVHEAEGALHRLEVRAAQAAAEWETLLRRVREDLGTTWEAVADVRLPLPREEAQGRLEALRGLVAALGAVNLRAIEEQEQLAARIAVLEGQVDDLHEARATLLRLVAHLDGVLRVRFRETFEAVSAEFGRLFVRLFEGGEARLELVQPADPEGAEGTEGSAEPGLEVVVRLPGKAMRPLGMLSGGERVLVALSLLFAMLRVHPSPFCVFDEVEAALDDANTRRFTTLLRDLAERTQIVIITHNKGTMEVADVLYGVTMQEPGVSTVLSVRLSDRPTAPALAG
ncbi:MAG: AAA family ATPase [Armatimonadota bacterium]|nr:AAA family ATPase [Armatimonadota bacterium]